MILAATSPMIKPTAITPPRSVIFHAAYSSFHGVRYS